MSQWIEVRGPPARGAPPLLLSKLRPDRTLQPVSSTLVSVVIPVLDERGEIERSLASTVAPGVERIVVDGGSADGTPRLAASLGAERVIEAPRGRARQMQAGALEARGSVVLFLHADTRLEPGWLEELGGCMGDPGVSGGAFRLAFESGRPVYRMLEAGVALRCRALRLPYGDQGLFVRRELLEAAGGVPHTPIFEDLDLVQRVRRGGRLALLRSRAWTSARRYESNGVVRQVARNAVGLAAWRLDVDRERVAAWYRARPTR